MRPSLRLAHFGAAALGLALASGTASAADGPDAHADLVCAPPTYYTIELVTTKNIPGTGYARGAADVTFRPAPFGISVAPDGSYAYDLHVRFDRLKAPTRGRYVAWATTTEIDEIVRLGELDDAGTASGSVSWNKFLVVVTLEDAPDRDASRWSGPVAFRGMSRSGRMHTMIGHGPLQEEKCAAYGYAN
ncbi:MAG: hypothetical protein RJQ04_14890 [Longimicrobiales bacterium]